jgi:hypothetical protein
VSLPSKAQQIAAIAEFLDVESMEGRPLEEIAKEIVEGYHRLILKGLKKPATPLRQGMLFKMPVDGKVRRVALLEDDLAWIVTETDSYGWIDDLAKNGEGRWALCEEFRPKTYKEVDGKRKLVEMTDEEIEEAWSNPEWSVGDRLSQPQRQNTFEIIATAPQSVLMRNVRTGTLRADGNSALSKHYRREKEVKW